MGVSYYASAAIGIRVDPEKLFVKRRVAACYDRDGEFRHACPFRKTDMANEVSAAQLPKFCPECGKEPSVVKKLPIEGMRYDDHESLWILDSFRVLSTSVESRPCVVVGKFVRTGWDKPIVFFAVPDIDAIRAKLLAALKPRGLWDDKQFGVYAVLYVS